MYSKLGAWFKIGFFYTLNVFRVIYQGMVSTCARAVEPYKFSSGGQLSNRKYENHGR